jgi:hypothetical protein
MLLTETILQRARIWLTSACRNRKGTPQLGPDGRLVCVWPQNANKKRNGDEIRQEDEDKKRARRELLDHNNISTTAKSKLTNFKHTREMLKTQQYRRALYIFIHNLVKTSNAVLLQPQELSKLLMMFDLAGYFKIDRMKIDKSILSAEEKTSGISPPLIISMKAYIDLMKKTGEALIRYQNFHNNKKIIFVVRMSTEGGGSRPGAWYCKSHLWTYLFFLKHSIDAVVNSSLLLMNDEATSENMQKATGEKDLKNILFIHLLDGIYSGVEAGNTFGWLDGIYYYMNGLIASPISAATDDSGTLHKFTCGESKMPEKDGIHYYAAKCLKPGTYFVLPFKIPEENSIGNYAYILRKMNPRFTPPYRRDTECRERH